MDIEKLKYPIGRFKKPFPISTEHIGSVRQIVHHVADSHINSYCRFKLAVTEDKPLIRPYDENLWSALIDANDDNIQSSLDLISGLHYRWSTLLNSLDESQLKRSFYHPEHDKHFALDETIASYAWHSNHHLAQIQQAITLKGDFS